MPASRRARRRAGQLRRHWRTAWPVRIFFVGQRTLDRQHGTRPRVYGDCWQTGRGFVVRVSANLTAPQQIDILNHEFAHYLADSFPHEARDHGRRWGMFYRDLTAWTPP